jgi:cyclopropane fatty-acyl-phospholipid synthase-like methyltransferase
MKEAYYHTPESVKEYIAAAKGFNGANLIKELDKYISPKASVLELGSGPGKDWQLLSNKYNVTGSDFSAEFISYLKKSYSHGKFIPLNAATLDVMQQFDAIYSNKVLHHLSDTELDNSIKKQVQLLNENGVVCHSFWKGEGSEMFKGMFVNYHSVESLKLLFDRYFDLVTLSEYKEFEEDDSILVIAIKRTLI